MTERTRRSIARRAGHRCEYCQCPDAFSPSSFSVEHIHPQALGGPDASSNLAWSCMGCNGRKATATEAIDPVSAQRVPLYHPRQQRWQDHFAWSEDALLIHGLTPIGRATVERLQLNRPAVVNLRRVLSMAGLHPPSGRSEQT